MTTSIKEAATDAIQDVVTAPAAEGRWTKRIENQTAKVPSVFFLSLAIAGILSSGAMKLIKPRSSVPDFIGLWVPTFLLLGLYNKIVKIEGNDRYHRA